MHFLTVATVDGPTEYPIDEPTDNWRVEEAEPVDPWVENGLRMVIPPSNAPGAIAARKGRKT